MDRRELLNENLSSLFEQYGHLITSMSDPDVHDIQDLSVGLAVCMEIAKENSYSNREIMEMIVAFLRSAYGVGLSRGGAETLKKPSPGKKPSPSIWHRIAKLIGA